MFRKRRSKRRAIHEFMCVSAYVMNAVKTQGKLRERGDSGRISAAGGATLK